MTVGNDGFTDCNYVCNPENFMQWSCNEICPGFEFIARAATATVRTTTQLNLSTNKDGMATEGWIVYLCIAVSVAAAVAVVIIVLIACCKKRCRNFFESCREKKLQHPTQVQTLSEDESGNITHHNDVSGEALPLVPFGTEQNSNLATVPSENSSDSGVVVPNASFHLQNENEGSGVSNRDFDTESNRPQHTPQEDFTQRGSSEVTFSFAGNVDTVPKRLSKQTCIITEQDMTSNENNISLGTPSEILRVLEDD